MKTKYNLAFLSILMYLGLNAGIVDVTYNTGSGSSWSQAQKAAFERAAKHWTDVLTPNHDIRVNAYLHNLYVFHGSNDSSWFRVLGYASADQLYRDFPSSDPQFVANTFYHAALAQKLNGNAISSSTLPYHITIHMNSSQKWYFGELFSGIGPKEYDFTTVVLHELAHGLGFSSSARYDSTLSAPVYNAATPYSMDRFVYKNLGAVDMTSLPASGSSTTSFLTSNSLYFKGSEASSQNGGNRPKIYAPSSWVQGSSLSHWDLGYFGSLNKDKLMEPQAGFANSHFFRQVGKVTRGFMSDIGWDVTMSVNENSIAKRIKLFPNPSVSNLNIYIDDDVGKYQLRIRSITGKVCYENEISGNQIAIPIENWNSGVYTVELINSKTGSAQHQKFIKTN